MALDSRDKRASALGVAVATFALVLPNPDGATLDQGDRQQVSFCYRGILAAAPGADEPYVVSALAMYRTAVDGFGLYRTKAESLAMNRAAVDAFAEEGEV